MRNTNTNHTRIPLMLLVICLIAVAMALTGCVNDIIASNYPIATATAAPIESATATPTVAPIVVPTNTPEVTVTPEPVATPEVTPTVEPTVQPSEEPSEVPTEAPTAVPTTVPTATPTVQPTAVPSATPTVAPTVKPTATPTPKPTATPTPKPTATPTVAPTTAPTATPTVTPEPTPAGPTPTPNPIQAEIDSREGMVGRLYMDDVKMKPVACISANSQAVVDKNDSAAIHPYYGNCILIVDHAGQNFTKLKKVEVGVTATLNCGNTIYTFKCIAINSEYNTGGTYGTFVGAFGEYDISNCIVMYTCVDWPTVYATLWVVTEGTYEDLYSLVLENRIK